MHETCALGAAGLWIVAEIERGRHRQHDEKQYINIHLSYLNVRICTLIVIVASVIVLIRR